MKNAMWRANRRGFLGAIGIGAAAFTVRGAFAEELARTPAMTEGPFYPDRLPLDRDNDLILVGDSVTPSIGEISHLFGRITDGMGRPLKDADIEIWQCDANAVYLHTADSGPKAKQQDRNFQGYGRFTTNAAGEYRFRTIKPVPYPGRPAPHIHFKISQNGRAVLVSQLFIAGHPNNVKDGIFNRVGDLFDQELVLADFRPLRESRIGELAAEFDIVVGQTPAERDPNEPPRRTRS